MSAVRIGVKKYGQITQIYVDGKLVDSTALTELAVKRVLTNVLTAMHVENWEVIIEEK